MEFPRMIEVFGMVQANGPARLERWVQWPGGKGLLVASMSGTGTSAKVLVDDVSMPTSYEEGSNGWNMIPAALSVGGTTEFSADGNHVVDLPQCRILFVIALDEGDSINIGQVTIAR